MDAYERIKVLGKGSYGSAVLVRRRKDGHKLVIKEVNIVHMPREERKAAELEAKVLRNLDHPSIVRAGAPPPPPAERAAGAGRGRGVGTDAAPRR